MVDGSRPPQALTESGEYRREHYGDRFAGADNDTNGANGCDGVDGGETTKKGGCCAWIGFDGVVASRGYATNATARGALVMSNLFLTSSFVYLASLQADCIVEGANFASDSKNFTYVDPCPNSVYGFKPASLVANVGTFSGLLSAFFMPVIGAIVDYTPHRRAVGIWSAVVMVAIQVVQIGTIESTWFPMLILQAFAAFIYQIQILAVYAYLPEIASIVGQETMACFTSRYSALQFASQELFLVVVVAVGFAFAWNDVATAIFSQALNSPWISIGFFFGWKMMPSCCARRQRRRQSSLAGEGTRQCFRTIKNIFRRYPRGLLWYFLAVVFGEAGTNAFTTISVIFMTSYLQMSSLYVGVTMFLTLLMALPGCFLTKWIANRTNPGVSWKLCLLVFTIVTLVASAVLSGPDQWYWIFLFGAIWGICLGWFYSSQNLIFSMILPKGQEAELSGFFVYMTQILVWLPPLVFSLLIEGDVSQRWGVLVVAGFTFLALICLLIMAPWDKVLEESSHGSCLANSPKDESSKADSKAENSEVADEPKGKQEE